MIGSVAVRHPVVRVALVTLLVCPNLLLQVGAQEREQVLPTRQRVQRALDRGDYAEAGRASQALISLLEEDTASDPLDLSRARNLLVRALIGDGRAAESLTLSLAESNLEMTQRVAASDGLDVAESRHTLADVLFQRGEFRKALPLHESGLEIRARLVGAEDEAVADSLERLSRSQMRMERYSAARKSLEGARTIRELKSDSEPLRRAHLLELFAWLDRFTGNYESARSFLERAQAIRKAAEGDDSLSIDSVELDGDLQMLEGNVAEARRRWAAAMERIEKRFRPNHPVVAALERRLAFASDAIGDRQEATRHLRRGLDIAQVALAPCSPERVFLQDLAATSLVREGQFIEAREQYEQALAACKRCLGDTHSKYRNCDVQPG